MGVLQFAFNFHTLECYKCNTHFAMSDLKYRRCMDLKEVFFCPNGHEQVFRESEVERLKRELEAHKRTLEWTRNSRDRYQKDYEHEKHRANGYKGALTRTKNRVGQGVCPCCNRTFVKLAAHMKTKHPQYANEATE